MPCYNAAATLQAALDSLCSQTLQDFEVVVVDDGSGDSSLPMLQAVAGRDPRFRIFTQPHQGIVAALNRGLQFCRSSYIARMDADDLAFPERLARQVAFLDAHPEIALVSCLVQGFPGDGLLQGFRLYIDWLNSLVTDEDIRREIFVESPIPHPSVVIRRTWLDAVGGYQEHGWAEDYDLWLRLYLAGARFAKLPEVLLLWREHPERLTRTDARYSLDNFLQAKACYLLRGPLRDRDAVFIRGAGMIGRRLSKYLLQAGAPLAAFIDIDPRKIGNTRRGFPILPPDALLECWSSHANPVVLAAVGARGARQIIRQQLSEMGLREGLDWWSVA